MAKSKSSGRPRAGSSPSKPTPDLYGEVTNTVIAALERGTVPWRRPWAELGDGLQRNLVSGNAYRSANQLLLPLLGFGSPWWLSFKQALARGGSVRKGEQGTRVTFWKKLSFREEDPDGEAVLRRVPLLRHYVVFNLEQCDGIEAPHEEPLPDFDPVLAAQALIDGMPAPPRITHGGSRAAYSPQADRVVLPVPEAFDPPSAYYVTAFHELGHATGHATRLARAEVTEGGQALGSAGYAREELVAEMTAAMLCATVGIDAAQIENSAAYLAHWLELLRGDPKLVVVAGARAQRAADWIRDVRWEEGDGSEGAGRASTDVEPSAALAT